MNGYILVTGGTGFIGQHLVRALCGRQYDVRVLVRPSTLKDETTWRGLAEQGAEVVPGDVAEAASLPRALEDVRAVFHLAGRLLVPGVERAQYERVHVQGTHHLLEACARSGQIERFVHVSTTGVLGPANGAPLDENAPRHPTTRYEQTKAQGEQLALRAMRVQALPVCVVRPALVYGPGNLHWLAWFRSIQRGQYRVVGAGDNLMHPIYIDDLIDGMLRCLAAPARPGSVYHLVGPAPLPISALAAAMARAMGTSLPREHLPVWLARAAAAVCEALPVASSRLPLSRHRVEFMLSNFNYAGERAARELGFTPQVDLETGLARTVAWYRQQGLL